MPSYDPQRSRPRQRVADDAGPAPVDALLSAPTDETTAAPEGASGAPAANTREPLVIDLDRPGPASPGRGSRRVVALWFIAVAAVVIEVLAWRWWRRRVARGDG